MVNIKKLRAKMVEHGINAEKLSQEMGIDKATFYRRLADEGETFSIREADAISTILGLTAEDVNSIFFSQFVAWHATTIKRTVLTVKGDERRWAY